MSQMDQLIYSPLLSFYWYTVMLFYFMVYIYILGSLYKTYSMRSVYLGHILKVSSKEYLLHWATTNYSSCLEYVVDQEFNTDLLSIYMKGMCFHR